MQVEEVFVEIPGFPNYSVSNYGNVVNTRLDRDMKLQHEGRRVTVKLWSKGLQKKFFVHRLVAQAFFVDYDEYVDVYHLSEDFDDNCVTNLHLVDPDAD